ncbi:MAG: hypothetical protein ACKVJ2_09830 [Pseudomonadales bacterium]|jgi:hypothetical protein
MKTTNKAAMIYYSVGKQGHIDSLNKSKKIANIVNDQSFILQAQRQQPSPAYSKVTRYYCTKGIWIEPDPMPVRCYWKNGDGFKLKCCAGTCEGVCLSMQGFECGQITGLSFKHVPA